MALKATSNNPALENALNTILERLERVEAIAGRTIDVGPGLRSLHSDENTLLLEATGSGGGTANILGLRVSASTSGTSAAQTALSNTIDVSVSPSVITGLTKVYVPVIDGKPIDTTAGNAPTLTVGKEEGYIYLRVEISPTAASYTKGDDTIYYVGDIYDEIVGDQIEIVAKQGKPADEQIATVDPTTGDVLTNGIYYVPLAKIAEGGAITQLLYGPMAWQYCSGGLLTVIPPTVVHTGPLVTLKADDA